MTLIKRLDGQTFNFDEADIRTLDFIVSSPTPNNKFESLDGSNGAIDYGTTFEPRDITGYFLAKSSDLPTFSLLRDEIFDQLNSPDPFYLFESRMGGKQWLVKVKDAYTIPQTSYLGKFNVTFTAMSGFAESISTTQSIQSKEIFVDDNWAFGMGLETVDDTELIYTQTVSSGTQFKIYNAGNVEVHPFVSYLKIQIKNVVGSSSNLSIVNKTNSSQFKVNVAVPSTDVWTINGPVIQRNSLMAVKDTSKKFLSIAPGWNTFEMTGATSADISFDFNFLYK